MLKTEEVAFMVGELPNNKAKEEQKEVGTWNNLE
jgi:hypothetical protein